MTLTDLATWRRFAGPKRRYQWQDARSAKECARAWLEFAPKALPSEIDETLRVHPDFGEVSAWSAEPEARVPFDTLGGEPANVDLLVTAEDQFGQLLIAIEAKADEPFGATIKETLGMAAGRRVGNPRSRGLERIHLLADTILGSKDPTLPEIAALRYQLLTLSAAAFGEARRRSVDRALVMVHEFVTTRTSDEKHRANNADLGAFVQRLSRGSVTSVAPGMIVGPILTHAGGSDGPVRFYVGKAVRNLRADEA